MKDLKDQGLISLFKEKQNPRVIVGLDKHKNISLSGAGNYSAKVFILADVLRERPDLKTVIWAVNDFVEQENVVKSLNLWSGWEAEGLELDQNLTNDKEVERANRVKILELVTSLTKKERKIWVITYQDLLKKMPDPTEVKKKILILDGDSKMPVLDLFEKLIELGYEVSEDAFIRKGEYFRQGGVLTLYPVNAVRPIMVEADFDTIGKIMEYDQEETKKLREVKELEVFPMGLDFEKAQMLDFVKKNSLLVEDELEILDEFVEEWEFVFGQRKKDFESIIYTPFLEEQEGHTNLHYFSVLKYQSTIDLTNSLQEKILAKWKMILFTKNLEELKSTFEEHRILHTTSAAEFKRGGKQLMLYELDKEDIFPHAFQNPHLKISVISDREIATLKEKRRLPSSQQVYLDFLTSLKVNDYVVHADHGIGVFQGLEKRTVDGVTREYLKIGYAENDKLFVPIDQADKVNKFIGAGEQTPRLTRLGSAEWVTVTTRVRKETQIIAKELLQLYAERENARGHVYKADTLDQQKFEDTFPYDETPGQIKAILDVKADMEKKEPMDRLICGDVGFGKTEVAMRAAFKAVRNGKQVALISPITILADQHYRSFSKRMDDFHIRVEMLSRFKTKKEQKVILGKLKKGEVDIVVGTHRLLQPDVDFKDLGLVVVDEEQRFGVKQKEAFKELRKEVDVVTLTATPIPRTLNISLNKLRDITTITTPPPGRLPVITEVRRFSNELIKESIQREMERGGQVYFLHNRVQTIEGVAERLRGLVPKARFVVAHGKLSSHDLEERIIDFKQGKYDVLVSSTIIENGIDLSNANTLIVNNAERFGLAQLYQLRGRVGRSKRQAYAYFLYHSQRLPLEAKKRLRAIVEASELGSGFQIAMKDLEIRGAGDILGVNQHGAISVVGVSHFLRMLNKAVEDLKAGKKARPDEPVEVTIELPMTAFIPDHYIVSSKEKIQVYQQLASADSFEYLEELKGELTEDYGKMPREVMNLFRVLELKMWAKKAHLTNIKAENIHSPENKQIILYMSDQVKAENVVNVLQYNQKWLVSGSKLKIYTRELGMHWFDELKESVKRLSKKVRLGAPKKKEAVSASEAVSKAIDSLKKEPAGGGSKKESTDQGSAEAKEPAGSGGAEEERTETEASDKPKIEKPKWVE